MGGEYERRKANRIPLELTLEVNRLFKQDHIILNNIDVELDVFDISKTGIGFCSMEVLPLDYYFNAFIKFDEKNYIRAVIRIIRRDLDDEGCYIYGAEFTGLAPFLESKIDSYEKKIKGDMKYY